MGILQRIFYCVYLVTIKPIIFLCRCIMNYFSDKRARKHAEKERCQSVQQEPDEKDIVRLRQQELYKTYLNSPLLQTILNTISGGNYQLSKPYEIYIYDDCVKGVCTDGTRVFDFNKNRVQHLEQVCSSQWRRNCEEFLVRPQVALAAAINTVMGCEYTVYDLAKRLYDNDDPTIYGYISDYVCMKLKPNRHF